MIFEKNIKSENETPKESPQVDTISEDFLQDLLLEQSEQL